MAQTQLQHYGCGRLVSDVLPDGRAPERFLSFRFRGLTVREGAYGTVCPGARLLITFDPMDSLRDILERFRRDFGLEDRLTDDEVKVFAYRHIDSDMSQFIRGVWIEGNVLVIQCTEPVAMQEFQARAEGIRLRINRDAGRAALASVRLTLYKSRRRKDMF